MEPTTLTATVIATLAFKKFLESSATELGKKITTEAINKIEELRQKIWNKLRGNSDAEKALKNVEQGVKEDLSDVATYLKAAMNKDKDFASNIQIIAQEINAGKIQNQSNITQNIYDKGAGFINEAKDKSTQYIAQEMHIHKNSKDT